MFNPFPRAPIPITTTTNKREPSTHKVVPHSAIVPVPFSLDVHNPPADELRERRNQRRRPNYARPELLASQPNELWSWDITKLLGAQKWTYFYLYVILDVFSRYIVGWTVAHRESAVLAEQLISATLAKQGMPTSTPRPGMSTWPQRM